VTRHWIWLDTDVLVIGGGPVGLAAARVAAEAGARVILCQQSARFASKLAGAVNTAQHVSTGESVEQAINTLDRSPDVSLLPRTTAFGY